MVLTSRMRSSTEPGRREKSPTDRVLVTNSPREGKKPGHYTPRISRNSLWYSDLTHIFIRWNIYVMYGSSRISCDTKLGWWDRWTHELEAPITGTWSRNHSTSWDQARRSGYTLQLTHKSLGSYSACTWQTRYSYHSIQQASLQFREHWGSWRRAHTEINSTSGHYRPTLLEFFDVQQADNYCDQVRQYKGLFTPASRTTGPTYRW